MNRATLIGYLGADPEARVTGAGTLVVNLRLATTERYKDKDGVRQERTEWHRISAFGALAENIQKYTAKGSHLFVEGRIQNTKYEDKDGVTKYSTDIVANTVQFLDKREKDDERVGEVTPGRKPRLGGNSQDGNGPASANTSHVSMDETEIPF